MYRPLQQQGERNDLGLYMPKHFQAQVVLARVCGLQYEAKLCAATLDTGIEKD